MAGVPEENIDIAVHGQGKAAIMVEAREIDQLQFRLQRQLGEEQAPPLSARRQQLTIAVAAADEGAAADRQRKAASVQDDPAQQLVQVPDIGSIAQGLVAAEMVQAHFGRHFFIEDLLHSGNDPVVDGSLQAAVHARVVLHLGEDSRPCGQGNRNGRRGGSNAAPGSRGRIPPSGWHYSIFPLPAPRARERSAGSRRPGEAAGTFSSCIHIRKRHTGQYEDAEAGQPRGSCFG